MFEILAIFGALAWLPHLLKMIKNKFIQPVIRIVTQRTAEIGYTTLGHIFNIKIAFACKNKDVVISGIKVKLKHESGDEKLLSWQGITQRFGEFKSAEGSSIPWEKEQTVLAIKLNPRDIEERSIRFQDDDYLLKKEDHENKIVKKHSHLRKNVNLKFEEIKSLEEYQDLETFIKQSFNWKVGKYTVTFILQSPENFKLLDNIYTFEINALDIDAFEKNKEFISETYFNIFNLIINPEYKAKSVTWNWRYPILKKSS